MADPFWNSAKVLLGYKRQLGLAFLGALMSAACFGAGVSMVMPASYFFLGEKQSLPDLVTKYLGDPKRPEFLRDLAQQIVPHLPTDRLEGFLLVLGALGLLTIIGSLGRYTHELLTVTVASRASMVWRGRLFRRLIHSPAAELLRSGSADHISRINADVGVLSAGYLAILDKTVAALLNGAICLCLALYVNWQLTLVGLIEAPIIVVILRKFGKRIRRASKRALQQRGRLIGVLKESFGGLPVVKVHNAEGYERRRFRRVNRAVFAEEMQMRQAKALAGPVIDTLTIVGFIAAGSIAGWLVFRQNVPPEKFIAVIALLAGAAGSLKPISSLNNQLNESRAAAERILQAANLPVEPTGVDTDPNLPALPRHGRQIEFENVTFCYPGASRPALQGVRLTIQHGQTIAIVGANGSGKSTLLNLLPRLLAPTSGRVLIDGQDIAGVNLRSLRSQMALVTQQTTLFEGAIADNIAYGRRHTPQEKIVAAARAAYADEFIRLLPRGYATPLGEDGSGLSGGQKQRLSIARAILRDPAILILDEATSQIDADSEAKINAALRQLHHGRTVLIIAHRLSTVIDADRIVVLADGQIVDQGKHEELLQRCPVYQQLTQNQLRNSVQTD